MRASGAGGSGIRVASPVITELRNMRAADPGKARVVDEAIRQVPNGAGDPIRIDVQGAPPGREYRAIVPSAADAPVVIYRRLASHEGGDWLVTTLIDRDKYDDYRRAERNGLLDNPVVNSATASATAAAETVASILVNGVPGGAGPGGDNDAETRRPG